MRKIRNFVVCTILGALMLPLAGCAFNASAKVGVSMRKAEPLPASLSK